MKIKIFEFKYIFYSILIFLNRLLVTSTLHISAYFSLSSFFSRLINIIRQATALRKIFNNNDSNKCCLNKVKTSCSAKSRVKKRKTRKLNETFCEVAADFKRRLKASTCKTRQQQQAHNFSVLYFSLDSSFSSLLTLSS